MSITDLKHTRNVITACYLVVSISLILISVIIGLIYPNSIAGFALWMAAAICPVAMAVSLDFCDKRIQKEKEKLTAIASAAAIDTTLLYPQKIGPIKPPNSNSLLEQISKLSGVSEFELVKSVEEYNNHEKQSTDAS